jgi:spermidine synthase
MVGSIAPQRLDPATVRAKLASPVTAQALADIGLTSYDVLASWYTAGPEAMRQYVGAGPLLTDDRPLVEYHRSLPRDDRPLDLSSLRSDFSEVVQ